MLVSFGFDVFQKSAYSLSFGYIKSTLAHCVLVPSCRHRATILAFTGRFIKLDSRKSLWIGQALADERGLVNVIGCPSLREIGVLHLALLLAAK